MNRLLTLSAALTLLCCASSALRAETPAPPASALLGESSHPDNGTYIIGEDVSLRFSGRIGGAANGSSTLDLDFIDENGASLERRKETVQTKPDGSFSMDVKAPGSKLGFYRVKASLADGTSVPKLGSRPAGFISYCIVPDPAKRTLYPDDETFFGIQGSARDNVNLYPYLGIRWILVWRAGSWAHFEPSQPGQFAEGLAKGGQEAGRIFHIGKPEGFYMLNGERKEWKTYTFPYLFSTPKWAGIEGTNGTNHGGTSALKPEAEKPWADYCREMAAFCVKTYPDMKKRYYQITWEPVPPWGYSGTDEQFIRIYELAYPAIHQVDPNAVVIGPTWSGIDVAAHGRLLKKGLGNFIDGIACNAYFQIPPEKYHMQKVISNLKSVIAKYCGRELLLIGTEQGFATKENPELELTQALGVVRENLIMLGEGWTVNRSFYLHDYWGEPGYGFFYNLNPKIEYGTDKVSPKPVAPAYSAMSFLLEGHKSAGQIGWLGGDSTGYVFERPDSVILALWDFGAKPREVSISTGTPEAIVYDWMGNAKTVKTKDGTLTLTLGNEPQYVKGVSSGLWGSKALKLLTLSSQAIQAPVGGKAVVKGNARLPKDAKDSSFSNLFGLLGSTKKASIVIEISDESAFKSVHEVMLSAEPRDFDLSFELPATLKPGSHSMSVSLEIEGRKVSSVGLLMELLSPVASVKPLFIDSRPAGLSLQLREMLGTPFKGHIVARVSSGEPVAIDIELKPHEEKSVGLLMKSMPSDPFQTCTAEIKISSADGYSESIESFLNFIAAKHLAKPILADGDQAAWDSLPKMHLAGKSHVVRSPQFHKDDEDLSADIGIGWDDKALYYQFDVKDDVHCQTHSGFDTWKGDCIQLGIDLDTDASFEKTGNLLADTSSHRRSEIDLALTAGGPEAFRTLSLFDLDKFPVAQIPSSKLPLHIAREGGRTVYRAVIPWSTLGAEKAPKAGDRIGISAAINDLDDAAQPDPSALGLFDLKDPSSFGKLLLDDESMRPPLLMEGVPMQKGKGEAQQNSSSDVMLYDFKTLDKWDLCDGKSSASIATEGAKSFLRLDGNSSIARKIRLRPEWKEIAISAEMRCQGLVLGEKSHQDFRVSTSFLDADGEVLAYSAAPALKKDAPNWTNVTAKVKIPWERKPAFLLLKPANWGEKGVCDISKIQLVPEQGQRSSP